MCASGTPFWKLVLKQFDDLLVKVIPCIPLSQTDAQPLDMNSILPVSVIVPLLVGDLVQKFIDKRCGDADLDSCSGG